MGWAMTSDLVGSRFATVPLWVLDAEVSDRAVRLYGVVQSFVNGRSGDAFPGRRLLASRLHCSTDSVDRAAKELRDIGALVIEPKYDDAGRQMTNTYRIIADEVRAAAVPRGVGTDAEGGAAPMPRGRAAAVPRGGPHSRGPNKTQVNKTQIEQDPVNKVSMSLVKNDEDAATDSEGKYPLKDEDWRLANLLADQIELNGSKRPTVGKSWARDIERLHRIDSRPYERIERAIRWCQQDSFWHRNILSCDSLRSHYDRLRMDAADKTRSGRKGNISEDGTKTQSQVNLENLARKRGLSK